MGGVLNYLASPWIDPNRKRSAKGDSLYPLDGIRGLAVVIVMASHANAVGMGGQGSLGVLLFFTLSGFVLMLPFAEHPERIFQWSTVWRFFANRALRILPIFAVAVLYIRWLIGENWEWATTNLTFAGGWTHLWSVAEEVRFYLLFPFVVALLALLPSRLPRIAALVAMILIAWRFQHFVLIDMMTGTLVEFDFWFFLAGALACLLYDPLRKLSGSSASIIFGFASLVIVACMFASSDAALAKLWRPLFPHLPNNLALNGWILPEPWCGLFIVLLVGVTAFPGTLINRLMQSWPMRHLGLLSYSLYLFHVPVMMSLERYELRTESLFLVTFAITYVVACVTYLAIEKPFLMLKPKDSRRRMFQGDRSAGEPDIGRAGKPASLPLSIGERVDFLE
jgi:peptidoglycan/LPS O-acetylase OafA/YrhL